MEVYAVGFGVCLRAPAAEGERLSDPAWEEARRAFSETKRPWQGDRHLQQLHDTFPVVSELGVPVAGLFILMLVFAAAIGPINLLVLARLNRRIWLLWTVPAMSLLTCLAVFVYMIIAEGWGGHARTAGVTILDQAGKRAATLARSAYYSPLTPSDGLRYPQDAEVTPLGPDHAVTQARCVLSWGGDQHLSRGWVAARVPAHFALRRSQAGAEQRLNLHRGKDGTVSVVNALGADIVSLLVADGEGRLYSCGRVPAGAEETLRPAPAGLSAGGRPWRDVYTAVDWGMKDSTVIDKPAAWLRPDTYLAVVEQSPFIEPGLRGAAVRQAPSVVLGVYSGLGAR
jgi:hypothetical protein